MTEISRSQFAVAAIAVVLVVLVGSRALGGGAAPAAVPLPPAPAAQVSVAREPRPVPAAVVVHVAGRVRRPGLYRLRAGARIDDAVRRAGGAARGADVDAINLAERLRDGEQVLVPRRTPSGGGVAVAAAPASVAGGATAVATPIDLNSASEEQLETIDGVGPATAQKILAYRQQHGGFRSVDDLAQISGIGPKKLAAMRPHVRV